MGPEPESSVGSRSAAQVVPRGQGRANSPRLRQGRHRAPRRASTPGSGRRGCAEARAGPRSSSGAEIRCSRGRSSRTGSEASGSGGPEAASPSRSEASGSGGQGFSEEEGGDQEEKGRREKEGREEENGEEVLSEEESGQEIRSQEETGEEVRPEEEEGREEVSQAGEKVETLRKR